MCDRNGLMAVLQQQQLQKVLDTNRQSEQYGLTLTQKDAEQLMVGRKQILEAQRRVELRQSILPLLVETFCSSPYLNQQNYLETLLRLQEIFFCYKNEMLDEITDEELLHFMREQFDTVCYGDLDYLEGTCLEVFAQAVRAGYQGHSLRGGTGVFGQFDLVTRWDRQLYLDTLQELLGWR